jgi:hypothetical protein
LLSILSIWLLKSTALNLIWGGYFLRDYVGSLSCDLYLFMAGFYFLIYDDIISVIVGFSYMDSRSLILLYLLGDIISSSDLESSSVTRWLSSSLYLVLTDWYKMLFFSKNMLSPSPLSLFPTVNLFLSFSSFYCTFSLFSYFSRILSLLFMMFWELKFLELRFSYEFLCRLPLLWLY